MTADVDNHLINDVFTNQELEFSSKIEFHIWRIPAFTSHQGIEK